MLNKRKKGSNFFSGWKIADPVSEFYLYRCLLFLYSLPYLIINYWVARFFFFCKKKWWCMKWSVFYEMMLYCRRVKNFQSATPLITSYMRNIWVHSCTNKTKASLAWVCWLQYSGMRMRMDPCITQKGSICQSIFKQIKCK